MEEVVAAYADTGTVKAVQANGLHIASERYVVIKADDRSLYGKKVPRPCPSLPFHLADRSTKGKEGVVIVKTTQAMLIAHYPESAQPGAATTVVEQLADYLIGVGY